MFVVKKTKNGISSLSAKEIHLKQLKSIKSSLAQAILTELTKKPSYPAELAKKLKVDKQKIYYHIRNLEKARLIEVVRRRNIGGAIANFYKTVQPAFYFKFSPFEETQKIAGLEEEPSDFLEPFIEDGKLNATVIVGSPDPHGPEKARSRDGYYGIDLALFLGTFLSYVPSLNVKLDTEARTEDLEDNLILIGGPVVNTITDKINNRMPIKFDKKDNWNVVSSLSEKKYHTDETGVIVKMKNPFNSKKFILVIAGKRYAGTKAVTIAFLKYFAEIIKGNKYDNKVMAKVVEGVDLDSDGIVDDVEVLE
ncbi:S-layer protein [Candidatus Woesearchaeota archaeon]|nr:S-layer protein [Candidatus Woesearchaeota archaeon]